MPSRLRYFVALEPSYEGGVSHSMAVLKDNRAIDPTSVREMLKRRRLKALNIYKLLTKDHTFPVVPRLTGSRIKDFQTLCNYNKEILPPDTRMLLQLVITRERRGTNSSRSMLKRMAGRYGVNVNGIKGGKKRRDRKKRQEGKVPVKTQRKTIKFSRSVIGRWRSLTPDMMEAVPLVGGTEPQIHYNEESSPSHEPPRVVDREAEPRPAQPDTPPPSREPMTRSVHDRATGTTITSSTASFIAMHQQLHQEREELRRIRESRLARAREDTIPAEVSILDALDIVGEENDTE